MNKELTPLEAFYKLKSQIDEDTYFQYDNKELLYNIKTALKEYGTLKEYYNVVVSNREFDKEYFYKCVKALEIIKNKRVDIATLLDCCNVEEYNRWVDVRSHYTYRPFELTQEEYDLLKEVLL